jgi:alginate O-acetyltransferase complex protein AlgI
MIFATKAFYLFLLVVLIGYYALPSQRLKYRLLLLASWFFYAWLSPQYLWVIWLLTLIDYFAARRIEASGTESARRKWLILSVVSNLGLLFSFKYTMFAYDSAVSLSSWLGSPLPQRTWEILLPFGISFHTFQGISYTVDVYRKQIRAMQSATDYAMFVAFFPQLAAGPIVRAVEFLPQMLVAPSATPKQVADGIWLFTSGLFKKLVIADNLDSLFVSQVFASPGAYSPELQVWATLAWSVQIYCDFSGYTDMARGCAKWFGFELPENFQLPYLATSITDFWRRWHLSLSTWLRDYLYFPLGGSRGSALRTYFNLVTIFVLCGLWHGAAWNWFVYGLYNGVLMGLHRAYDRACTGRPRWDFLRATPVWAVLAWAITAMQFLVGMILIRMTSWENGTLMLSSLFNHDAVPLYGFNVPAIVALLMLLGLVGHFVGLLRILSGCEHDAPDWLRMPFAALLLFGTLVFSPGVVKTFIYIHF